MATQVVNNMWYAYIAGRGPANETVPKPFGFVVHAIVYAPSWTEALQRIETSLSSDGLSLTKVEHKGKFNKLIWDDVKTKREVGYLVRKAELNREEVHFSAFHTWPLHGQQGKKREGNEAS